MSGLEEGARAPFHEAGFRNEVLSFGKGEIRIEQIAYHDGARATPSRRRRLPGGVSEAARHGVHHVRVRPVRHWIAAVSPGERVEGWVEKTGRIDAAATTWIVRDGLCTS